MKYWLYFAAKVIAGAIFVCCLQLALNHFLPAPKAPLPKAAAAEPVLLSDVLFAYLLFTFLKLGIWLLGAGILFGIVWDQKRRCRSCLRPLIMPIVTGSWGHIVFFGRPCTEWICPYGHGTLSIAELQITGRELPDWQPHDDNIWKELESYYQARE